MRKRLRTSCLLLVVSVWTPLGALGAEPCVTPPVRQSDADVYRAVLADLHARRSRPRKPNLLVVLDISPDRSGQRVTGHTGDYFRRTLRAVRADTIETFLCAAMAVGHLPDTLVPQRGIELVSGGTLHRALERPGADYWREFGRRYPRASGVVSLSRVAYAPDGTEAMVHVAFRTGLLGGDGQALVLKRESDGWHIVEVVGTWES